MTHDDPLLWRAALVPYLDLFCRLDDTELVRLSGAPLPVVVEMRSRVIAMQRKFGGRRALLSELTDVEIASLTRADVAEIGFWRLTEAKHECRAGRCGHAAASEAAPEPVEPSESAAMRAEERIVEAQRRPSRGVGDTWDDVGVESPFEILVDR